MINIISFPNDTHFLIPLACLSTSIVCGELIAYPFDRISSIMVARSQNKVSTLQMLRDIIKVEGLQGLYRGSIQNLDKNLSKNLIQYFCFNVLYNNFAYMHIFLQKSQLNRLDQANPNLKFIDLNLINTTLILQSTVLLSIMITQTKHILKCKIQCDALGQQSIWAKQALLDLIGYHENMRTILFRPGLFTRFIFENTRLTTEIAIFQYLLNREHYVFQNLHKNHDNFKTNNGLVKPFTLAATTSAIVTTLCYPLKYMNQKSIVNCLRNQSPLYPRYIYSLFSQNIFLLYRGFFPYLTKCVSKSSVQMTLMWKFALYYKEKNLKELI